MFDAATLEPIGLAELETIASLQTRADRRYVIPDRSLPHVLANLADSVRVLEIEGIRCFRYSSVYFDTPDLRFYLAAARGRPRRLKVRTRTYADSGLCMLEVKVRDLRGRTAKHRWPHPPDEYGRLSRESLELLAGFGELRGLGPRLRPTLVTEFRRTTVLMTGAGSRLTIDTDVRIEGTGGRVAHLPYVALVETKSRGAPTPADRLLWTAHHRPVRFSKYGAGMAAIRPELPGNRWHRVIRDHVVLA